MLTNGNELAGLGKAERVEPTVPGERSVEPLGASGVGEPQGIAIKLAVASSSLAIGGLLGSLLRGGDDRAGGRAREEDVHLFKRSGAKGRDSDFGTLTHTD